MNMGLNHRQLASEAIVTSLGLPAAGLNVDSADRNGVCPESLKCGIRFEQNGLVTIVIGSTAYDRGYASSYLAGVVSAALGIPLSRLRLYYSGALPAVRLTPRPVVGTQKPQTMGLSPIAKIDERLQSVCREVIARGCKSLAEAFDWQESDIVFEPQTGCFASRDGCIGLLELARKLRRAI